LPSRVHCRDANSVAKGRLVKLGALAGAGLLAGVVSWGATYHLGYYAIAPGGVIPVVGHPGLLRVANHDPRLPGRVYLVYVYLDQVTPLEWISYHFSSHVELVPAAEVSAGYSQSVLDQVEQAQMVASQQAAEAAALSELGYRVKSAAACVVDAVLDHSPAARLRAKYGLAPGDLIVEAGRPVSSVSELGSILATMRPGEAVRLAWVGPAGTGKREATVQLARGPRGKAFLGLMVSNGYYWHFPLQVQLRSDGVNGPSGGLAFALGIMDELTKGKTLGSLEVAATGTVAPNGAVGPVGGVEEKAWAVYAAGLKVFLVPASEVAEAREAVGDKVRIIGVSSLKQAAEDLAELRR